jgi:hypothetical protein
VETPHKFITAVINLRGVSTNKTIICFIAMQTYKELIINTLFDLLSMHFIRINFKVPLLVHLAS